MLKVLLWKKLNNVFFISKIVFRILLLLNNFILLLIKIRNLHIVRKNCRFSSHFAFIYLNRILIND